MTYKHTAIITCGKCHKTHSALVLGIASAIACEGCQEEITLGEGALPDDFQDPSLNVVLDTLGLTHRKAPMERNPTGDLHDIFDWGGSLLVTLNCHDTWGYLRLKGLYPRTEAQPPKGNLKEQADLAGEIDYLGEGDRIEGGFGNPDYDRD
jgi:hypothetical protein